MKRPVTTALLGGMLSLCGVNLAAAQTDQYLGEIRLFGFNFCPVGWAAAQGQILNISQNAALFALYGTFYGGNGTTTFGLPNLAGRAPYGVGQSPGLPNYVLGELFGNTAVTLMLQNLPPHTHQLFGTTNPDASTSPAGALMATIGVAKIYSAANSPPNQPMAGNAIGITGGSVPVSTQSPGLALTWCVATQGVFPTRP